MAIERRLITAEEFEAMPDDGRRHELHEGVVVDMAPANWQHGEVMNSVGAVLRDYLRNNRIGRSMVGDPGTIVHRGPDTVLAPDVAVVLDRQRDTTGPLPARFVDLAPALIVEIRSPFDCAPEIADKTRRWLEAGAELVWNVDPETETVEAHWSDGRTRRYTADDTLDAEPVLPGFGVPVRELFA